MKTETTSRGNGRNAEGRNAVVRKQTLERLEAEKTPRRELSNTMLLGVLMRFRRGDFSVRLPEGLTGIEGKIADAFNEVVEVNERMTAELERVSRAVGKEGKISQRAF